MTSLASLARSLIAWLHSSSNSTVFMMGGTPQALVALVGICLFGYIPFVKPLLMPWFSSSSSVLPHLQHDQAPPSQRYLTVQLKTVVRYPSSNRDRLLIAQASAAPSDGKTELRSDQEFNSIKQLEKLSRSELQSLCKKQNIRAVGKTSELLFRVLEAYTTDGNAAKTAAVPTKRPEIAVSKAQTVVLIDAETEMQPLSLSSIAEEGSNAKGATGDNGVEKSLLERASGPDLATLDEVRSSFEDLSERQWGQVRQLGALLAEWNSRVNLISRKDIANVMRNHVVPCLAMAKALRFEDRVEVLDVGTGGGLPGLPLAIYYPNVQFTLIDGKGKKIKAVQDMADRLGLENVRAFHVRAEDVHETFDFVIGRAVTSLPKFVGFIEKNLRRSTRASRSTESVDDDGMQQGSSQALQNGILYMRGEVNVEELSELGALPTTVISLERSLEFRKNRSHQVEAGPKVDDVEGGNVVKNSRGGDDESGGGSSRGYSSVFHFAAKDIWNRVPAANAESAAIAGAAAGASAKRKGLGLRR